MNTFVLVSAGIMFLAALPLVAQDPRGLTGALSGAPEGFVAPPLHPRNATLQSRALGPGVYALVASIPGVDNGGFIVGERGVLVIDAGINAAMAQQIISAVRAVTPLPILYLVNTNHHGDHTFGNATFPAYTQIVAHEETARSMRDFDGEKRFLLPFVQRDTSVFAAVTLRLPTLTFRDSIVLDLGGRSVAVHHFGRGNTNGDAVVYEPRTRTAWTGNLVLGPVPLMLEAGAREYRDTIDRFRRSLQIDRIVAGHLYLGPSDVLAQLSGYLGMVADSIAAARTRRESAADLALRFPLPRRVLGDGMPQNLARVFEGLHQLVLQRSYDETDGTARARELVKRMMAAFGATDLWSRSKVDHISAVITAPNGEQFLTDLWTRWDKPQTISWVRFRSREQLRVFDGDKGWTATREFGRPATVINWSPARVAQEQLAYKSQFERLIHRIATRDRSLSFDMAGQEHPGWLEVREGREPIIRLQIGPDGDPRQFLPLGVPGDPIQFAPLVFFEDHKQAASGAGAGAAHFTILRAELLPSADGIRFGPPTNLMVLDPTRK